MWNANVQILPILQRVWLSKTGNTTVLSRRHFGDTHALNLNFGLKNYVEHNIIIIATNKTLAGSKTKLFITQTYRTQRKRQVKRHRETI